MAQYPTAVKSFTSKSTSDVVQAAHVNDLQDEVNAIEAGLLNGTAPLNSSNSTVANLSVTGGSTLGNLTLSSLTVSNLQVSSGSTFAGRAIFSSGMSVTGNSTLGALTAADSTLANLSVTGNSTTGNLSVSSGSTLTTLNVTGGSTFASRPIMPAPPALRVELGSTVSLSSAAVVLNWLGPYAWASSATQHSTATDSSRFTPDSTGLWSLFASLEVSANSTAPALTMTIRDSSAGLVGRTAIAGSSAGTVFSAAGIKRFDVVSTGTWLSVNASQDRASTLSAIVANAMSFVEFRKL